MYKKIFTFALGVIGCTMTSIAQNNLNIYPKEGNVVTYAFKQNPKITYEKDNLVVTVEGVKVTYPLSNLRKFTFEDLVTDISLPSIVIKENEPIYIYSINGILVKTIKKNGNDARINLDDLDKGIYIINCGKLSYKITKE